MSTPIEVEDLLERLLRTDSRNPALAADSPGEGAIARQVATVLEAMGLEVTLQPVDGERANVIAVLPGIESAATVILEAHLDTVPADAATMAVRREGRRLYGRGACDTKGSLAAMIGAVDLLRRMPGPRPTVLLVGAVDEEYIMRGARQLARTLPSADAVVIGEPTSLLPARAHNGFVRVSVGVRGTAAHSSRAEMGVNAIVQAGRLVTDIDAGLGHRLRAASASIAGPALLSATMISGGIAPNVIPDRCTIWFDRRVPPGIDPLAALEELRAEVDAICARTGIDAAVDEPLVALGGLDTPPQSLAVRAACQAASTVLARDIESVGVTYSTDACCFYDRPDLPCVVLGPGSIEQAHGEVEWIDLDEVIAARDLYVQLALDIHALKETAA
ncbi:M20/M25/M40 family metallo-hydrolase [Leifsonia sp. H3M29-4]|uniref:M20 family metallopeptidase n=1 Tax=Salinibacterium metalliresistens TaxID=3031321 RepID=UPI0023DBD4FA|nr:M20/M25/M40 family metallo-hydrolase [Salinibacterium metalliresistens]MDF1480172.1 M20/M25/M40 family metallo-hydrolase [Salinibacterium metalliresistens]